MTDAATALDDATLRRLLDEQSDLLLDRLTTLDDAAARGPSLLPGWSRGHVLTHLARNADSLANTAAGAVLNRPLARYLSLQQRDQDIKAGAGRPADQLVADTVTSCARLQALLGAVPAERAQLRQPDGRGGTVRAAEVRWLRLREVAYHHVDLDLGYTFGDVPVPVLRAGLAECPDRLAAATPGVRLTCTFADAEPLQLVIGDGSVAAQGHGGAVLAWLTGRSDGSGVSASGGPLPVLPSWG